MLLPFVQYHEIDGNIIKSLNLSMLLNDTANGRKKKNCKFWLFFANLCKALLIFVLLPRVFIFDYSDAIFEKGSIKAASITAHRFGV